MQRRIEKTRKEGLLKNKKEKDNAFHCVRCNADIDEAADKKNLKEKQFNDDSTNFLSFSLYFYAHFNDCMQATLS
jgi:hypothetical protein